jgi:hypothetical protein
MATFFLPCVKDQITFIKDHIIAFQSVYLVHLSPRIADSDQVLP